MPRIRIPFTGDFFAHRDGDRNCEERCRDELLSRRTRVQELLEAIDLRDRARSGPVLDELLMLEPGDPLIRLLGSEFCAYYGDEAGTLLHLAVAQTLEPNFTPTSISLANILRRRGDKVTAKLVLEAGWKLHERHVRRGDPEAERTRWFAVLNEDLL